MIRRFFADGLHWMAIAGVILGTAVYGLYTSEPTVAMTVTVVEQIR
ncbi:hypothetical protein [Mycolicibacterium peregrinum]